MEERQGQTWCATLAWRGDAYAGWQLQPNVRTIQGEVEQALARFCGSPEPVRVSATGRTDAGVHAEMQIIGFRLLVERLPHQVIAGINQFTDDDIVCLDAKPVSADFSPRSWTKEKLYRYRILNRIQPCPFRVGMAWHLHHRLDVAAMQTALPAVVGTHDFTSFRAARCAAKTAVRHIVRAEILRLANDEVQLDFVGHGFLRHQVRIMVGTLVDIGLGRREPGSMSQIRDGKNRTLAGRTAPAHGLTLMHVTLMDKPSARGPLG